MLTKIYCHKCNFQLDNWSTCSNFYRSSQRVVVQVVKLKEFEKVSTTDGVLLYMVLQRGEIDLYNYLAKRKKLLGKVSHMMMMITIIMMITIMMIMKKLLG